MTDKRVDYAPSGESKSESGPFLARVVNNLDTTYMGILEVEILRPAGGNSTAGELLQAKYMSPFYGVTSTKYVQKDPDDYNNTQKSYGMWMVPPDVGVTVMVMFVNGDPKQCYWIGCVPDINMNFMVPGIAATQNVSGGTGDRAPTAEYNKQINDSPSDPTQLKKPEHPLKKIFETQGLIKDDIRGLNTSSARRESPSMVFGISTPGPIDKQPGAKKGPVGREEYTSQQFVSRLGGSTFVMDDGDDKFLRMTKAGDGPPTYAAVEQGDTSGDPTIPHNELFRIRTRTGHQILLHNSEDLIYIANSRGTAWIELTSNGKIDIYAKDSISLHTANDFNITADRDINFTATGDINLNSGANINQQTAADFNAKIGGTAKINPGGDFQVLAANTAIDGGNINLNSGVATAATPTPKAGRIPQTEPWPGHENLDPTSVTPDNTKATTSPTTPTPAAFGMYTTKTDTFNKVQGGS